MIQCSSLTLTHYHRVGLFSHLFLVYIQVVSGKHPIHLELERTLGTLVLSHVTVPQAVLTQVASVVEQLTTHLQNDGNVRRPLKTNCSMSTSRC